MTPLADRSTGEQRTDWPKLEEDAKRDDEVGNYARAIVELVYRVHELEGYVTQFRIDRGEFR